MCISSNPAFGCNLREHIDVWNKWGFFPSVLPLNEWALVGFLSERCSVNMELRFLHGIKYLYDRSECSLFLVVGIIDGNVAYGMNRICLVAVWKRAKFPFLFKIPLHWPVTTLTYHAHLIFTFQFFTQTQPHPPLLPHFVSKYQTLRYWTEWSR